MKTWTSILAAGAILAFAAPAAHAATDVASAPGNRPGLANDVRSMVPSDLASSVLKVSGHVVPVKRQASPWAAYWRAYNLLPWLSLLAEPAPKEVVVADCVTSMADCTVGKICDILGAVCLPPSGRKHAVSLVA
jgi:hypothetical protein